MEREERKRAKEREMPGASQAANSQTVTEEAGQTGQTE